MPIWEESAGPAWNAYFEPLGLWFPGSRAHVFMLGVPYVHRA